MAACSESLGANTNVAKFGNEFGGGRLDLNRIDSANGQKAGEIEILRREDLLADSDYFLGFSFQLLTPFFHSWHLPAWLTAGTPPLWIDEVGNDVSPSGRAVSVRSEPVLRPWCLLPVATWYSAEAYGVRNALARSFMLRQSPS